MFHVENPRHLTVLSVTTPTPQSRQRVFAKVNGCALALSFDAKVLVVHDRFLLICKGTPTLTGRIVYPTKAGFGPDLSTFGLGLIVISCAGASPCAQKGRLVI